MRTHVCRIILHRIILFFVADRIHKIESLRYGTVRYRTKISVLIFVLFSKKKLRSEIF